MGEIADKVTEKNLDGNITEVLTNSAEYGVINQTEFFDHAVAKESNIAGYYVIAPGDFVYNPRISATAPVGPIRRIRWEYTELCLLSTLYSGLQMQSMELISATSSRQMAGMVS